MRFAEKTITLKDGRTCILKPPAPEMAKEMVGILKQVAAETPFLSRYPDEVDATPEDEKEFLAGSLESTDSALVIATVDGKIAGHAASTETGPGGRSGTAARWGFPCWRNTGDWESAPPSSGTWVNWENRWGMSRWN